MAYYIGQALGLVATVCCFVTPLFKKKWQMLVIVAVSNLLFALNLLLIGQVSSAIYLYLVAIVQAVISYWHVQNDKPVTKAENIVFLILYFLIMLPSGMSSIFALLINIDCADYAEYTTGKNMTAITNSVYNVSSKAKSALGGVIPGVLLVMVGYSVNSATGAYQGDLSALPGMVTGLSIVAALIPAILSFVCVILYKKFYKLTNEQRAEMTAELDKRHAEQAAANAE